MLESEAKGADPEVLSKVAVSADPLSTRVSYEGTIDFDAEGLPMNPRGRTGMRGRGVLWKWGPNHASDPVVVRRLAGGRYQILMKRRARLRHETAEQAASPGGAQSTKCVFGDPSKSQHSRRFRVHDAGKCCSNNGPPNPPPRERLQVGGSEVIVAFHRGVAAAAWARECGCPWFCLGKPCHKLLTC